MPSSSHSRNGLDDLRSAARLPGIAPRCVAVDTAALRKYAGRGACAAWELGLLHSRVDPDFFGFDALQALLGQPFASHPFTPLGNPEVPLCKPGLLGALSLRQPRNARRIEGPTKEQVLAANLEWVFRSVQSGTLQPAFDFPRRKNCVPWLILVAVEEFERAADEAGLPVAGPWPARAALEDPQRVTYSLRHEAPCLRQVEQVADEVTTRHGKDWPPNSVVRQIAAEHGFGVLPSKWVPTLIRPALPKGRRPNKKG